MLSYQPCLAVRGSIPYDLFFSAKRNVEKRATFTSVRKIVDIRDANSRRQTAEEDQDSLYRAYPRGRRDRDGIWRERNGSDRRAAARCSRGLWRRETAAGHRAKVRKRRCENRGGLHRHTPNAETAVVGAKKNLRRTRSARIDANKTRVGFG